MKHAGMVLFLVGVALVVGSCVPVGYTFINVVLPDQLDQKPLALDGESTITLRVPDKHEGGVRLGLRATFANTGRQDNIVHSLRYRYSAATPQGRVLQSGAGIMDADNSTSRSRFGKDSSDRRWSSYEKIFAEFTARPGQPIQVVLTLIPRSPLSEAQLKLLGPKPEAKISLMTALVLWVLGIILALTGGLLWLQNISTTPDAGRAQSAQMSLDLASDMTATTPTSDERIWAMICHLSVLSVYILLPFGHLLGPLIVWLAKRDRSYYIDWHGREALNFNFSVTLYALAGLLMCLTIIGLFVGIIVLFLVFVLHVAATLYVAIRAQQSDWARYPLSIRFISPPPRSRGM